MLATKPAAMKRIRKDFEIENAEESVGQLSDEREEVLSDIRDSISVIGNYLLVASGLISRRRIDRDLFFENLAVPVNELWTVATVFEDVDATIRAFFGDSQLRKLAEDARAWDYRNEARHIET